MVTFLLTDTDTLRLTFTNIGLVYSIYCKAIFTFKYLLFIARTLFTFTEKTVHIKGIGVFPILQYSLYCISSAIFYHFFLNTLAYTHCILDCCCNLWISLWDYLNLMSTNFITPSLLLLLLQHIMIFNPPSQCGFRL